VIRPRLNRRSDRVLAGEDLPRSRGHPQYVIAEAGQAVPLTGLGITVLARLPARNADLRHNQRPVGP
jgi:hypothetical protein